ncbi:hypothetical protein [Granulosicoccus antarcticus]|uniref:Gamma-glutamylcyclotransferase AIG2-like domain-containing protein n=1 Tax=Granulosicoccus antarcticus IMCC3135 TaxID=1192854 RepID=A0A2Z2P7X1_9GAMM|nr:hypothetical protein [Granulosicoccus antarcticus]ASJ76777.1 hypothetical protein IMCC3135_33680 [Granulosicoccus antarcticus IMCC3135]
MNTIGILAYGSLIEDPGIELQPLISGRVNDVETPFNIEFARSSRTRDGAPTVVPVNSIGASVEGVILVLNTTVGIDLAKDLLWRRETRNEGSDRHYANPTGAPANQVMVVEVEGLGGIDVVLYTSIKANISHPTVNELAHLAINSAKGKAGSQHKDGISYLISLKRQNIETPLMAGYEAEILNLTGASSLEDALAQVGPRAIRL